MSTKQHKCAVNGCERQIPLDMLMCAPHWRNVPSTLKAEVNRQYTKGQEITGSITPAYAQAARAAVDSIETKEAVEKQAKDQGVLPL